MSLLNQQDYTDWKNNSKWEASVNNLDKNTYYYNIFEDNYYYPKYTEIETTNFNVAQSYGMKPGFRVDPIADKVTGVVTYYIDGDVNTTITDASLIQQITDAFNQEIDAYKKTLPGYNKEKKQKEWDSKEKAWFNSIADGWDYDTYKTDFKFSAKEINKTLFVIPDQRKVGFLDDDGYFVKVSNNSPGVPDGVWEVLKQRVAEYKTKKNETIKEAKKKEAEKLNKDNSKPDELEKKNIEEQPGENKKELKDNIKEENDANKKEVEDNKPKLVIKIPKPFAMGYFIIDLSALLKGLLGLLSALALGLLMSKLADLLKAALSPTLNTNTKISASDMNKALNSINLSDVLNEVLDEENILKANTLVSNSGLTNDLMESKTPTETFYDTISRVDDSGTFSNSNVDVDLNTNIPSESKNIMNKNNKKREIYTMNKRNRKDLLDSPEANDRLNNNNTNKRTVYNKNYGRYW